MERRACNEQRDVMIAGYGTGCLGQDMRFSFQSRSSGLLFRNFGSLLPDSNEESYEFHCFHISYNIIFTGHCTSLTLLYGSFVSLP
jgi:hypothetical protein